MSCENSGEVAFKLICYWCNARVKNSPFLSSELLSLLILGGSSAMKSCICNAIIKFVFTDFDQGQGLKALLQAEQNLFQNNFPQVIMAHAVSSIVANYDLVVQEFDGCSVPVLQGQPVFGKKPAMRAVLSVFGQIKFNCGEC